MKLILLLSIATLVASDYPASQPEPPSDSYGAPVSNPAEEDSNASPSSAPLEPLRSGFNFQTIYRGAVPPSPYSYTNFLSRYNYPCQFSKNSFRGCTPATVSFGASPQGILPPISQIIPPISQVVPPISQVIPPVFGGIAKPVTPPQVLPPQVFPPQVFPPTVANPLRFPQIPRFTYNFAAPTYYNTFPQYSYFKTPYPFYFPPSTTFFSTPAPPKAEPPKTQETLSASYGPPAAAAPAETSAPFEPSGPAENSAPFEPAPVSYPYEPAVPDAPESAPHKPAQEYGIPSKK